MNGRTIRLYLVDGQPTGILTAEIINWTGKIIVAPRAQLPKLAHRGEVKKTGVYCLSGPDPENTARDIVYIGEGDSVLSRLSAHDRDETKDFWTRCAVVTSKDENLTKAHGRYLESRLIEMGKLASRSVIHNGTGPSPPPLPESDVADMEFFLSQIQMVFPVLGFGFLQPKTVASRAASSVAASESPLFALSVVGVSATAREVGNEFVVLKGSAARKEGTKSWTSYRALRDQLVHDGKLVSDDDPAVYVFADDVAFSSPSAGAAVVNAGNMNGRTAWKVSGTGETYQDWYDKKLAAAGALDEDSGE